MCRRCPCAQVVYMDLHNAISNLPVAIVHFPIQIILPHNYTRNICVCVISVGEATVNLTSLYDIVTKLSKELVETKRRLDIAEQKLKTGKTSCFWAIYGWTACIGQLLKIGYIFPKFGHVLSWANFSKFWVKMKIFWSNFRN